MASPFDPIPNNYTGMDAFAKGAATSQNMMDTFMRAQLNPAHARLLSAQADREEKMASLPFGGAHVPGPAGNVLGLEMMRQMYGENSPQYQQAKNAFTLSQSSIGSRIGYQDALTRTMPIRYMTPEGKLVTESNNVRQGASPAGTPAGTPIIPGMPNYSPTPMEGNNDPNHIPSEEEGLYNLAKQKKTAPTLAVNRSLLGTNAENTLNNINPEHLTSYSGITGGMRLIKDKGLSATGQGESEEYKKYNASMKQAQLLSKIYRQMMGDSIDPRNQDVLNNITNPTSWIMSPEIAKENFNQFAKTLRQENATFKAGTKNTDVYSGHNAAAPANKVTNEVSNKDAHNRIASDAKDFQSTPIHVYNPKTGNHYHIPEGKVQKAIEAGYQRIG